jgi:hypothetical protein
VIPGSRTKARLIKSTLPNPEAAATCLSPLSVRSFQLTPCRIDPHLQNVLLWCSADLSREYAFESPDAHRCLFRKFLYRESPVEIFRDPDLKLL